MHPSGLPICAWVLWALSIGILLSDWFLRSKFALPYLGASLKLNSKEKFHLKLTNTGKDQIQGVGTTNVFDDSKNHCVWMQCKFQNNRSTLGLIRKWNYNSVTSEIESEETRLSVGVVAIVPLSIGFAFFLFQSIKFPFQSIFFVFIAAVVPIINWVIAYNRLKRESDWTLEKITESGIKNQVPKSDSTKEVVIFKVPFGKHAFYQFIFLIICAIIQFVGKIEMSNPYFMLTGIHFIVTAIYYQYRTRTAFDNHFRGELKSDFGSVDVATLFFGKKVGDQSGDYLKLVAEIRRSIYLTLCIFFSTVIGAIALEILQTAMRNNGIICSSIKF
ncbi:MAG TPA: hypothetical protein VK914_05740 [bacterium]|nr:hypothetical protein [bacterium]